MVKGRVYNTTDETGQKSAIYTLHKCLSTILLLLAPICPFITEKLWTAIYSSKSIHLQHVPQSQMNYKELTKYTKQIMDFNSIVWNKKKETISKGTGKPLSLKDSIDVAIPVDLGLFKEDLQIMHNLKNESR
jgi:valyl-tRNA synthetase